MSLSSKLLGFFAGDMVMTSDDPKSSVCSLGSMIGILSKVSDKGTEGRRKPGECGIELGISVATENCSSFIGISSFNRLEEPESEPFKSFCSYASWLA